MSLRSFLGTAFALERTGPHTAKAVSRVGNTSRGEVAEIVEVNNYRKMLLPIYCSVFVLVWAF